MPEFNIGHEGVCHGCAAGKHKRGPFPSSESQTTRVNAGQELEKLGSVLAQKNSPPSRM